MRSQISDDITFRKLEILLAYMEGGNLNAAARMLDISAVSVHRALHSLEEGMSCQLFSLQGRNLIPNEAAQVLADVSREVVKLMADGIAATRSAAGYSADHLRIGSLYSLTTGAIPEVIIGIKLRKQEIETELVLGSNAELLHKLKQNAIDAALMGMPDPDPEIESIPLFEDDVFFAAPAGSPYAKMKEVDLRACASEKFVCLKDGFVTLTGFQEAFRIAGYAPTIVTRVGDILADEPGGGRHRLHPAAGPGAQCLRRQGAADPPESRLSHATDHRPELFAGAGTRPQFAGAGGRVPHAQAQERLIPQRSIRAGLQVDSFADSKRFRPGVIDLQSNRG